MCNKCLTSNKSRSLIGTGCTGILNLKNASNKMPLKISWSPYGNYRKESAAVKPFKAKVASVAIVKCGFIPNYT